MNYCTSSQNEWTFPKVVSASNLHELEKGGLNTKNAQKYYCRL